MDKQFLKTQMMRLETNYGSDRFRITKPMFDLWMEMFADCEEAGIKASVNEYMLNNEYPPTIASIMKIYREKEQLRKEVINYVLGHYKAVSKWYGEPTSDETYLIFKDCVCSYPLKSIKGKTDELVEKLMDEYNSSADPSNIRLKEILRGMK